MIIEDLGHQPSSVDGWVGVHGADEDLQLTHDSSSFFLVGTHYAEGARALPVQAHVLHNKVEHFKQGGTFFFFAFSNMSKIEII